MARLALLAALACVRAASGYTPDRLREVLSLRHAGLTVVLENVRKENVALIARTYLAPLAPRSPPSRPACPTPPHHHAPRL